MFGMFRTLQSFDPEFQRSLLELWFARWHTFDSVKVGFWDQKWILIVTFHTGHMDTFCQDLPQWDAFSDAGGFEVASPNWNVKWGQSTLDDRNIEAVLLNQKNGWGEWNVSNDLQHIHSWCINVSCLSSRNSWNVLVIPASLPMASDDIIREEVAAGFVYNIRRLGVLNRLIFKEVPEDIVDFVICQFI